MSKAPGGELPAPRGYHSFAVVGGRAYMFGGKTAEVDGRKALVPQKLCVYDFAMTSWVRQGAHGHAPFRRSSHRSTAFCFVLCVIIEPARLLAEQRAQQARRVQSLLCSCTSKQMSKTQVGARQRDKAAAVCGVRQQRGPALQ